MTTIDDDDLAAHSFGSSTPDILTQTRQQERELPYRLSVQYLDANADYQPAVQYDGRITTDSVNEVTIELPLVLSDDEGAQAANILLYAAWTERVKFEFKTSMKYAYLDPSDVITITVGSTTYTARITDIDIGDGLVTFKGVAEDTSLYVSSHVGGASGITSGTVTLSGSTKLILMDIPILRNYDNDTGFYAAVCGYLSGWTGSVIFQSSDSVSYTALTSMSRAATIGYATDVLADGSTAVWDNTNTVNVRLINGTLSSDTEINVLNLANAALLGDELIQFKTATLEADGSYTLSGLIRGRRGTEWATSGHAIGDTFVLISTATLVRIDMDSSILDASRYYKGVTLGQTLQKTSSQTFTNTGIGLKPYSPVWIRGSRDGSNNLTITWLRRSRLYTRLLWSPSLGEDSESYEVDIYNGAWSSVLRTITASSETASYTAAEQTTDGLTPGDPVNLKIYQLSATVGRGYAGTETV